MGRDGFDIGGNSSAGGRIKPGDRQHHRWGHSHAVTLNRKFEPGTALPGVLRESGLGEVRFHRLRGKLDISMPGPKGASHLERLAVSLKRYPDTKLEPSAGCSDMPPIAVQNVA